MFLKIFSKIRNSTLFQRASSTSRSSRRIPQYSESGEINSPSVFNKRFFKPTDTYHARDLNSDRLEKHLRYLQQAKKPDYFDKMNIDIDNEYKNVALLSAFINELGMVKSRKDTGLSFVNQRRLAKAVKRCRAMGLMSYTYKMKVDTAQAPRLRVY